ncbi:MAG TPA: alpha/beta fold hydrolase [Methylomirabilota bacterium]|nr:alpha/beta fold hydrolase [Methylomirabilota bacterium]
MSEEVHQPPAPSGDGLVLTHGAGGNARAPLLVALGEAFAARGVTVLRYDLPFRQASRTAPPRPAGAARDREGLRLAVASLRSRLGGRVFLGGQSYGGRQASMLAAGEPGLVDGLLLLSYPLHPPGRSAELRTAHLPKLTAPTMFAHGSRDPFGTLDEIEAARPLIAAPTSLLGVTGAGHDLFRAPRRAGADVAAEIASTFLQFLGVDGRG